MVGHQLTLADALLVSTVSECFELVLLQKQFPNLSRYTTLILKMPPFVRVFGVVIFCKEIIQPIFEMKAPRPAQPAKDQKPAGGKE